MRCQKKLESPRTVIVAMCLLGSCDHRAKKKILAYWLLAASSSTTKQDAQTTPYQSGTDRRTDMTDTNVENIIPPGGRIIILLISRQPWLGATVCLMYLLNVK